MPNKKYSKIRSKRQSWRFFKKKSRLKRKLKILSLSIIVLASTALSYSFVKVWDYYLQPKAKASDVEELKPFYAAKGGFSVFVAERVFGVDGSWSLENPKILSVNKSSKKMALIAIPYDWPIETATFGVIKMSGFGRVFGQDWGSENFFQDLENSLGVPIEGIFISNRGLLNLDFSKEGFLSFPSFLKAFIPARQEVFTNLTLKDLVDITLFRSGLFEESLEEFEWNGSLAEPYFAREEFLKEALRLEIVNGSALAGLASFEAKKLSMLGIKVSSISNVADFSDFSLPENSEDNVLFLSSRNISSLETVKYLKERYHTDVKYVNNGKCPAVLVLFHEP